MSSMSGIILLKTFKGIRLLKIFKETELGSVNLQYLSICPGLGMFI